MPKQPQFDLTVQPEGENPVGLTLLLDEGGGARYRRYPVSILPPAAPTGEVGPDATPPEFETTYVIDGAELGPGATKYRQGARRVGKSIGVDTGHPDILIPGPKVRYTSDINMLTDGGFEVWSAGDLTNWTSNNVSDLQTTSSPTPEEGTYCAKITGTGASPSLEQAIGTHFAQCYVKIEIKVYVPTGQSTPTIRLTDGSTPSDGQPTGNDAWETVTVEYDYSSAVAKTACTVQLIPGSTSDHFFVDEAKVYIDRFVGPAGSFAEMGDEFYLSSARTVWKLDTFFKAQDIAPAAIKQMVLFNDQLCSAMGGSNEWEKSTDGATWATNSLAGDNRYADGWAVTVSNIGNPVLWKFLSPNKLAASTNPNQDLGWVNYTIGDSDASILSLVVEDNVLYIRKEDGIWTLGTNGVAVNLTPGWRATRSASATGVMAGWDGYVYVPAQRSALWRFDTADNKRRPVHPGISGADVAEYSGSPAASIGYGSWLYSFIVDPTSDPATVTNLMKGQPFQDGFRWSHLAQIDAGKVESTWVTELKSGLPELWWQSKDEESASSNSTEVTAASDTQTNTDASSGREWANESNVEGSDDSYATWPDETSNESEQSPGTAAVTDYSDAETWDNASNATASDDSKATSDLDGISTGNVSPSANNGASGWSTPGNAYASDDAWAQVSLSAGASSAVLELTTLGLAIPSDANIKTVTLYHEGRYATGGVGGQVDMGLVIDGVQEAAIMANRSLNGAAVDTTVSQAWTNDGSVTPALANQSNFGVWVRMKNTGASTGSYRTDHAYIVIEYSLPDTDGLKLTNFGFSLPSDATVVGIEVDIEKSADVADTIKDEQVRLLNASGVLEGDNKADVDTAWGTSDATANYGGSTDMWGTSFTKSDVEDSDFGVEIRATKGTSTDDVIASIDHVTITIHYTAEETGDYLDLTNFGFAVPTGATIDGITVEVERSQSGTGTSIEDVTVQMIDGGSASGDNLAKVGVSWPASDATAEYGGPSTSWGVSWTVAKVNATNFGVRLQVKGDVGVDTARIDHVTITVHYTTASGSELDNRVGYVILPSTDNPRHDSNYEWESDVKFETGILNRFPGWFTSWHEIIVETSNENNERLGSNGRKIKARYDSFDGSGFQDLADGDNEFSTSPLERKYFRSSSTASVVSEKLNLEFELETTDETSKLVIEKVTVKGVVRPTIVEVIECSVMIGPQQAALGSTSKRNPKNVLATVRKLIDSSLGPARFWDRDGEEHQVMVDIPNGGYSEGDIAHYIDAKGQPEMVKGITLRLFIVPNSSSWDALT